MTDISENAKRFLAELFEQTGGDGGATVSMYDVGEAAGLDGQEAGDAGEELIGWGMVEVRTLSGGVAIAEAGIAEARDLGIDGTEEAVAIRIGPGPVLAPEARDAVDRIVTHLKGRTEKLGLGFDEMAEWMADLKTLDAQLSSPRPKTAVVREVFRSILEAAPSGADEQAAAIRRLLGE